MNAIQIEQTGDCDVLLYKQIDRPVPSKDEVLIKTFAIGVNPVDTYIRKGDYSIQAPLPYTPGWECAGEIVETGQNITQFKPGDRVYTTRTISGAYAQYCTALEDFTHSLPDNISWTQGACIGIAYGTAYRALFQRGQGKPGQWILIHGAAGAVGLAAVDLAVAHGMSVVGTASTKQGQEAVKAHGAHLVVNHHDAHHLESACRLAGVTGFDLILELAAHINLNNDLAVLNKHGTVLVVGNRGTIEIDPRRMMGVESNIKGVMLYGADTKQQQQMHAAIFAGLKQQTLKPTVGHTFELKDANLAHQLVESGQSSTGKIILRP